MKKIGDFVVKNKIIILIVCALLLVPSIIGMINTKVNYNILVYLPSDIETMKGQDILANDFKLGSYAVSIFDNVSAKDALKYEKEIKQVDGVNKVVSLYDVVGTEIPLEMLPDEVQQKLAKDDSTLLFITFKDSISDEKTLSAVEEIRSIAKNDIEVGGMSSMVLDTKNLADEEVVAYVLIAVACCIFVLMLTLDSYVIPLILLANIGVAILYNMGSNIILGDISYITKAISSILQLGVTTDFSIFLYHQYELAKKKYKNKNEAMSNAIGETINSIVGSSTTTIAGFLALCAMQLTLGADIGIVMAKGVVFGVLSVVTLFPSLVLVFDNLIEKTSHKPIVPEFKHLKNFVIKRYKWIFIIFLLLIIPAWWGQKNTEVYYNLDKTLPTDLASSIANTDLEKKYNIVSPMIALVPKTLSNNEINKMVSELESLDNIDFVLSYSKLSDLNIPEEMLDDDLKSIFQSDNYYLILINSNYEKATTELNSQINEINKIVKGYDKKTIVAGEGALVKDLVEISDTDFNNVSYSSVAVIFIIIIFVLKSYSLPIILIATIEFAIFINMAVPFYTGTTIPFVSSIVIGTIQLGATIDYAILMTNKYLDKRKEGADKFEAVKYALDNSVSSIFISGMCFFAATFGVGLYSKLEMVGSLCSLIARGAIISMLVVILVLPTLLIVFDKLITKSTKGFKKGDNKIMKKTIKVALVSLMALIPLNTYALTKEETVYVKTDYTGTVNKTIVSEHLVNDKKSSTIKDISYLSDIVNTNGDESFKADGKSIVWNNTASDIYYKGLTNKSLPIDMKITYTLDGKSYDKIDDIKGKAGHVKVTIKYTNNEKHGSLYTPFTIMMGALIDSENSTNVKVVNGTTMDNGKNMLAVGIAMPGLDKSLNVNELSSLNSIIIDYDTTNFDTLNMYSIVTPKFIDTKEISSSLNTLYSKMDLMSSSSKQLVNGASLVKNGAKKLNTQYKDFNDNVGDLSNGLNELSDKYDELNTGLQTINNNLSDVNKGVQNLDQLIASVNDLAHATKDLATATANFRELKIVYDAKSDAMTAIIDNLTPNQRIDFNNEIDIIQAPMSLDGLEDLATNINSLNDNVQVLNLKVNALSNLKPSIEKLSAGLNTIAAGSTTVNTKLGYISASTTKLNGYSKQIYAGTSDLVNGTDTLANGMVKFDNEAITTLSNLVNNTLKGKVDTLNKLNNLSKQYNSFGGVSSLFNANTKFIIQTSK